LSVLDQTIDESGQVVVAGVTAPEAGWLAIHADFDGQPAELIGYVPVEEGTTADITVEIEPLQATSQLHALLYLDESGAAGEPPGATTPLNTESAAASAAFAVELELLLPGVTVADQSLGWDGQVVIEQVVAPAAGWLAIYADANGEAGQALGATFVEAGVSEAIIVGLNARQATRHLYAALHEDTGQARHFDFPEADPIVLVARNAVISSFEVTLPPDVFVLDQPILDGQVVVERAASNGPGWVVIQPDVGGVPGLIVGFAHLEDGINEQIVVPVVESEVTEVMYVALHHDDGEIGEFEVVGADVPVRFEGRLPDLVSFRTTPERYLITRDQPVVDGSVVVPIVVSDIPLWVVVYTDAEGIPGTILGETWIPAGIARDVVVAIDPQEATPILHAVLHLDQATPQRFDFPGGDDVALLRNRQVIEAPFTIEQD
jgi:hypothetical protein